MSDALIHLGVWILLGGAVFLGGLAVLAVAALLFRIIFGRPLL